MEFKGLVSGRLLIAFSLLLALAGCKKNLCGALDRLTFGAPPPPGCETPDSAPTINVQSLLQNTTNVEMTDLTRDGTRYTTYCSGTDCTSGRISSPLSYHQQWLTGATSGNAHVGDDTNFTYQTRRLLGQYSAFYTRATFYANTRGYYESYSVALGGPERRPTSGTARWTGDMSGHEIQSGTQLNGKSTVTYSFGNNTVDVVLSDVRGSNYFGDSQFSWRNVRVNNDGSFSASNDYLSGNFYGPNSEETSGVFERGYVAGGWFASRN